MQEKGLDYVEKSIKDSVFPVILALGQIHF